MTTSVPEISLARRIQRISRLLAHACLLLIVVLPIVVVIFWQIADPARLASQAHLVGIAIQEPVMPWQRWAGGLITEVPLALLLIGIWHARKCFRHFAANEIFTSNTVRCLQRFAGWAMISVGASIVAASALSIVLTLNNAPSARHFTVSFGTDQILTLFFAGMVWLMAAVIGQGKVLADENATFV